MCGIVGCTLPDECSPEAFDAMVDAMARRGPDGRGTWRDEFVALGHRRLAVIDPTPCGAQPMANEDGSVVVVFNGEIYNHRELRKLLPDARWKSSSDTETILRLYEREGIEFVHRLNGMFAIAIHDRRRGKLLLLRDRLGIKPLAWSWDGTRLVFASDLRAMAKHPRFDRTLGGGAVRDFFTFNYVPAPKTIFRSAHKLRPGGMLELHYAQRHVKLRRWWKADDHLRDPREEPHADLDENAEELRALLLDAVKMQTLSDVPLGCFLSGGIDSSAVAWALSKASDAPRTFCIGFREADFDESPHAARVAKHLGTRHTAEILSAGDCLPLVERVGGVLDEPFADASLLPTLMLSEATRRGVTVSLSGDGGDELFAGYDRYRWFDNAMKADRAIPAEVRRFSMRVASLLPFHRARTAAAALSYGTPRDAYGQMLVGWNSEWVAELFGMRAFRFSYHAFNKRTRKARGLRPVEHACFSDLVQYMPDDLLSKVDRASMHHSLEVRVPLLDHRIVEFALKLPLSMKYHDGASKIVLKRALRGHVPDEILARPKAGFAVPLRHWLRRELRPLAEELLRPESLAELPLPRKIDPRVVERTMRYHMAGRWNHERQLWALMVFVLWHREAFGR